MRASTFSLVSFLALVASVASAPVAAPGTAELLAVPNVDESSTVFESAVEELEADEDVAEHVLDKRGAQTCKKTSQCKNKLTVKNSVRVCSSKKCTWACKSGYTKKGNSCNKKVATKSPSKSSSSSAVSFASSSYSGKGTYFYQNGNPGACGVWNKDSTYLVALQSSMYSGGKHCGKNVRISANGKTITAKVQDECPTCVSTGSLDLSEGAFKALSSLSAGMIDIKWTWA
ncbi:hypothetical protein JCM11251_002607 [Rhodosporidiobolus azoricus]